MRRASLSISAAVAALLGAWLPVACGPDASNEVVERTSHACLPGACPKAAPSSSASDASAANMPLEPWNDKGAGPYSGIFAAEGVITATVAGIPVTLRMLFRLRLLQFGTYIQQSNTLCALKLPSVPGVATLVIPPALENLIQDSSDVVTAGNYLSNVTYTPPDFALLLGAKLKDPKSDPLPTMAQPAGEFDEDKDGHPGVTIDATVLTCTTEQQLYVALRTGGSLKGTFSGFGKIDGKLDVYEEQSVLGYSDPCLAAAANILIKVEPGSPYHAVRVADEAALAAKGNVTCPVLVGMAPSLFGSGWKD